MISILGVHLAIAAICAVAGHRLGRRVMLLGAVAPLYTVVWLLVVGGDILAGNPRSSSYAWVPGFDLTIGFRVDELAVLMLAIIGGVGVVIFVYAWQYFDQKNGMGRFAALLLAFTLSMVGLVISDNLLILFVFWELTSITSYLLIGWNDGSATARASALRALLVTGGGGLALLAGLVILGQASDSYSLQEVLFAPPTPGLTGVGVVLVLVGAFSKSAQVPFHFWLPGAMTAPTPVSAYLHSATMVKAGIYLLARMSPTYAQQFDWWQPVVMGVGALTMIVGGWRSLTQYDIKRLLAMGTVSQLGFMVVLVGSGVPQLVFAGMALILAHSLFKAALFMISGVVDHQTGTRDIRQLRDLGRSMRFTLGLAILVSASMVGIPPLVGFVAKEAALAALIEFNWAATTAIVLGSVMTTAYALRFLTGTFGSKYAHEVEENAPISSPSSWFVVPVAALALLSLLTGMFPSLIDPLVGSAAEGLIQGAGEEHLALWHGWNAALGMSLIAILGGFLLWRWPLHGLHRLTERLPGTNGAYKTSLVGINRFAEEVTSRLQNGSLPVYLGVILMTAIVIPGWRMFGSWRGPEEWILTHSWMQMLWGAIVVIGAAVIVKAKRRLVAVIYLGVIGYSVAVLFVIQGAPDLALTQFLVETLSLGIFVLVLRHLPDRFEHNYWRLQGTVRIVIAVGVGLTAGAFAIWAGASRSAEPSTELLMDLAYNEGEGRNVVNVILTGIRAFDTVGEITVLTVVALGVAVLLGMRISKPDKEQQEEKV